MKTIANLAVLAGLSLLTLGCAKPAEQLPADPGASASTPAPADPAESAVPEPAPQIVVPAIPPDSVPDPVESGTSGASSSPAAADGDSSVAGKSRPSVFRSLGKAVMKGLGDSIPDDENPK